jgi:hypothetical protein
MKLSLLFGDGDITGKMDVKHHALRDTPPSKKIINSNLNN